MDEEYKQSEISKEVQRLMDEEGYEFGEAVKEAMSKGYKDGGLMVAIQKFNQGGNVIDSRATVEDMAKAIQTSSAGTDNQKLRLLMDYGMSVNPQATPQTISSSQGKMEKLLGLQPNPNFNYMKPSGPAMIMPPMASTGFRQDPGYFGNEGFIINGKRYMSEDEAIDDMGIETYNRFMAKGGMAGGKTYHQYHDQFVPPDSESMGYANGGGVGSMMQPKINVPQLVTPSADGSRPGYRGDDAYGGGGGKGGGKGGGNKGGPPGGGDRGMRSSPSSNTARERGIMSRGKGPKGTTGNIGGFKDSKGPDRSKVSQFSTYGRNKMNQNLTTNNPSRRSGILNAVKKNFNPLSLIAGAMFGPLAGLATRAITTPGIRTGITNAFSGLNEKMRGINPVTGKVNTQAEYEAMVADRKTQSRIDNMTDRMLAGKSFSQKNLDSLMGQMDRFGNPFGTNLGSIDNVRGPNSIRAQLNAPVVESIINEVIKAPPAKPNVTRDITYGDFPNAFNYLDVEDVDLYGTPKSTMPNYGPPGIMNPTAIERADPFSIDLSNAMADASTNTNQQILDTILNENIMKNQVQPYIDNQQKKNEELEKMRQELGLA